MSAKHGQINASMPAKTWWGHSCVFVQMASLAQEITVEVFVNINGKICSIYLSMVRYYYNNT